MDATALKTAIESVTNAISGAKNEVRPRSVKGPDLAGFGLNF